MSTPVSLAVEGLLDEKVLRQLLEQAARDLWIPAINNHGGYGRWAFVEVTDPWDAKNTIRASLGVTEGLL